MTNVDRACASRHRGGTENGGQHAVTLNRGSEPSHSNLEELVRDDEGPSFSGESDSYVILADGRKKTARAEAELRV